MPLQSIQLFSYAAGTENTDNSLGSHDNVSARLTPYTVSKKVKKHKGNLGESMIRSLFILQYVKGHQSGLSNV